MSNKAALDGNITPSLGADQRKLGELQLFPISLEEILFHGDSHLPFNTLSISDSPEESSIPGRLVGDSINHISLLILVGLVGVGMLREEGDLFEFAKLSLESGVVHLPGEEVHKVPDTLLRSL